MPCKRQPSNDAVEATIKAICRFWAVHLGSDFHPHASAADCGLESPLADRYDEGMHYILVHANDAYGSIVEAGIRANPSLYGSFDYQPERSDTVTSQAFHCPVCNGDFP